MGERERERERERECEYSLSSLYEVQNILHRSKSLSSSISLQRPPAFTGIELQGNLNDAKYLKVQGHLWELFCRRKYNRLAELTDSQLCTSPSSEWAIVGMWFELMNCVFIHECKDHQKCVAVLLKTRP